MVIVGCSVKVIDMLCLEINSRTESIHEGVRYGTGIVGCSSRLSPIPASNCEYCRFKRISRPAEELEKIASLRNFTVSIPSSVRRS